MKRTVTNKTVEYVCEKLAIFDSFLLEIIWDILSVRAIGQSEVRAVRCGVIGQSEVKVVRVKRNDS